MRPNLASVALLLVCAAVTGTTPVLGGPATSFLVVDRAASDQADELLKRGLTLAKADRWAEAEPVMLQAWRLKRSYDIAGNLGIVEAALNRWRDAAEHLTYAFKTFPANGKPELKKLLEQMLAKVLPQVAAVTIKVSTDRAEVFVDGKSVGAAPLAEAVFVEPGTRTIEAKLAGYGTATATVDAAKGGASEVMLTMTMMREVIAPPPRAVVKETWRPGVAVLVPGGVLAVGGLAAGVGLTVAANAKRAHADALQAMLPGSAPLCAGTPGTGFATTCAALKDTAASRDALSKGAVAGFVLGGAFGVATAGLGGWAASSPKGEHGARPSVRVVPFAGATGGGLVVVGEL